MNAYTVFGIHNKRKNKIIPVMTYLNKDNARDGLFITRKEAEEDQEDITFYCIKTKLTDFCE